MIDRRFPPPWSGAALAIPAGGKAGTVATGLWRMDKIELYKGFEIRAFEREQGRKADGSTLKTLVADSGHRMSITTSADTLTAEATIDEVKKAIDAGGMS